MPPLRMRPVEPLAFRDGGVGAGESSERGERVRGTIARAIDRDGVRGTRSATAAVGETATAAAAAAMEGTRASPRSVDTR